MALPIKMNLDGNRILNEDGISNYTMNANYSSESNAVHNEYGFIELQKTNGLRIIGWKKIFGNQIVLCSQVIGNELYACEIGIMRGTDYSAIVRDNPSSGIFFNFDENHLIQIEAKLNINNETIIYFVDGLNPDKFLNITNPQVALGTELRVLNIFEFKNMIAFRLNTAANVYLDGTGPGGSLLSGVYYVLITLWNKGGLKTHSLVVSNPIPIYPADGYVDGSTAGTSTNQKIDVTFKVDELEDGYDYYTVYAISKINQVIKAYEVITSEVPPTDFSVEITSLEAATEVSPDSILINSSDYISALTLTQVDDVLFKGNLKSIDSFDFQPYVNNINVRYVAKSIDFGVGYADSTLAFYDKAFMYDETYALYASFIVETDGLLYESKACHIPGREAVQLPFLQNKFENDKITTLVTQLPYYTTTPDANTIDAPLNQMKLIDVDAKIFQGIDTSMPPTNPGYNMGYWENDDEFYSEEAKWNTLDRDGIPTGKDLRGLNVRHHKFPEAFSQIGSGKPNMIQDSTTALVLGIKLENIVIPAEYKDKVKGIKLYYAKRDINNRTVLGQSLAIPQHQKHRFVPGVYVNNIFNTTGSFYVHDIIMNTPVVDNEEGFAPTNVKRDTFVGGIYNTGVYNTLNGLGAENYCFPTKVGGTWDTDHGFITMHPFDTLSQSVKMNASHLKNVCRLKGIYRAGSYNFGSSLSSDQSPWVYTYRFDNVTPSDFFGIDRADTPAITPDPNNFFYNNIRKIANIELLENTATPAIGQYWRKFCEKRYVIEFAQRLRPGSALVTGNVVGQDFGLISLYNPSPLDPIANPPVLPPCGVYNGLASPYLTNVCSYKKNIFLNFDNKILCSTGFNYQLITSNGFGNLKVGSYYQIVTVYPGDDFTSAGAGNNNVGTTFQATSTTTSSWDNGSIIMELLDSSYGIYGGDTFTSLYGERTTIDFSPNFDHPDPAAHIQQLRTIHYYMCQSTSNIRLRHEGVNSWEIYFPKTQAAMDSLEASFNNYYGYNIDYSAVNDVMQPTQELNRLDNDTNLFPNRIIRSQVNNPELLEDNYLIFLPGNVTDVGLQYGQIENLFNITNKLAIHLTNDLMLTMNKQTMDTSSGKAYIGAGDIFSVKPQDINSNYYGGTVGRYSGTMTPYGYFFIDPLSYNVFNFDGNQLHIISAEGMEEYFCEFSNFKFPEILNNYNRKFLEEYDFTVTYSEHKIVTYLNSYWIAKTDINVSEYPGVSSNWVKYYLPSYNIRSSVGSLGYTVTYDSYYDRIIFSKIDYTFMEDMKGFEFEYTGFYDPDNEAEQLESYITFDNTFGSFTSIEIEGSVPLGIGFFRPTPFTELFDADYIAFNGFTLSYYPKIKSWVSFYSYIPELLIGGSQNLFSSKKNTVFEHNQNTSPFYYGGEEIRWFIEPLYKMQGVEQLSSFSIKTDKIYFNQLRSFDGTYINLPNLAQSETFDRYFAYNKNQMSFEKDFINADTSRDVEGYFRLNDFRDYTKATNPILFDITSYGKTQRLDFMDAGKHWTKLRKFTDFWQSARFTKDSSEFVDTGDKILQAGDIMDFGIINLVQPKSVVKLSDGFIEKYAVIDSYGIISDTEYKLRYLFGTTPFPPGTYNVKVFNGYNLSLLDTQANKKPSHR